MVIRGGRGGCQGNTPRVRPIVLLRLYGLPFPELNDGITVFGQLPIIGVLPDALSWRAASGQVLSSALVD